LKLLSQKEIILDFLRVEGAVVSIQAGKPEGGKKNKNIKINITDGRTSTNVVQLPTIIISSFTCGKLNLNSNMIYTILRESKGHGSVDNHIWRLNSQENNIEDKISSDDPTRFFVGEKIPIHFFSKYFQYPFDLISSANLDLKILSTKISEDNFLCDFHLKLSDIKMRSPEENSHNNFQPTEENIADNFLEKKLQRTKQKVSRSSHEEISCKTSRGTKIGI